jgi:hypothetical protein
VGYSEVILPNDDLKAAAKCMKNGIFGKFDPPCGADRQLTDNATFRAVGAKAMVASLGGSIKNQEESTTTLEPAWLFLCHPVKDEKDCGASADSASDQSVHHYCQSILPNLRIHSDGPDCRHVACNHTADDERNNYGA